MANLGICLKKCEYCDSFSPAELDGDDNKISSSEVLCSVGVERKKMWWDSETPDGCPYCLEHLVTKESLSDLAEEAVDMRR